MEPTLLAAISITGVFLAVIGFKTAAPMDAVGRICALCIGVSLTWAGLLTAYWAGLFPHPELIGLLMGSTVLGTHHILEQRASDRSKLFRLPAYLTLMLAGYTLLSLQIWASTIAVTAAVWALFGAIYAYQEDERVRTYADHVIACCKDW